MFKNQLLWKKFNTSKILLKCRARLSFDPFFGDFWAKTSLNFDTRPQYYWGCSKPLFGAPSFNWHQIRQSRWQSRGKWGQEIEFSSPISEFVDQKDNVNFFFGELFVWILTVLPDVGNCPLRRSKVLKISWLFWDYTIKNHQFCVKCNEN